jgi:hypothetical protein
VRTKKGKKMSKEQIEKWKEEKGKLKEKLKLLDQGRTKLESFGDFLSLFTSLVVVFMYGWIVIFTFFHTEFIERMFSGGLNFVSWTQMRFTVLIVLPLVIWVAYDSFKNLKSFKKKKNEVSENRKLRVEILKEIDRLENLIKNQLEEN